MKKRKPTSETVSEFDCVCSSIEINPSSGGSQTDSE